MVPGRLQGILRVICDKGIQNIHTAVWPLIDDKIQFRCITWYAPDEGLGKGR